MYLAIACEVINSGNKNLLRRVTLVNRRGGVVLDQYVKQTVTGFRRFWSILRQENLEKGFDLSTVSSRVEDEINGCGLIGYSLQNDLDLLQLSHPEDMKRDFAKYKPFLKSNGGQPVALRTLFEKYLGIIAETSRKHDAEDNARSCMELYGMFPDGWE